MHEYRLTASLRKLLELAFSRQGTLPVMYRPGPLPDFVVIGAQKAGTGSIHAVLSQHPAICMPQRTGVLKELHFFNRDQNYYRGLDYYRDFFCHCTIDQLVGEVTPNYLFDRHAARRITDDLPHAQLVVCLREPISRAVSQYRMEVLKDGVEGRFEDLIQNRDEYLARGRYAEQLERYASFFDSGRLYVCFYEHMIADAREFYHHLFGFLNVSRDLELDFNRRVFIGGAPRSRAVMRGIRLAERLYRPLRRIAGQSVAGEYLTRSAQAVKNEVLRANRVDAPPPTLDPELLDRLHDHFSKENARLERLVGRLPAQWYYGERES